MLRRVFRLRFARRHLEEEVDEELAFHLAMRERSLQSQGLAPSDARDAALRQFGSVTSVRDDCITLDEERHRAMHRASIFTDLKQDVVYALRALRHNIGFTAIAVATLGLGIGANTAIFVLIDAVLLQKLPVVRAPEQLVAVGDPARVSSVSMGSPRVDLLSWRLYRQIVERNRSFSGFLASARSPRLFMTEGAATGEPESPRGRLVSGNYFKVLQVPALIGRTFDADADLSVGAAPMAVISYDYWQRRFNGDPRVLGKVLTINGAGVSIIGVTPPGYNGEIVGARTEIWLPLSMQPLLMPNQNWLDDAHVAFLLGMGRLAPGVRIEQAQTELGTLIPQILTEISPDADFTKDVARIESSDVKVSDGSKGFSRVRRDFFVPLMALLAGVGLLLLIVCANVANLLLARATARAREMNLRVALGAGRFRLVRQLLTESAVLALLGAATGLVAGWWGSRLLLTMTADGAATIPVSLAINAKVTLFTIGVSLLAVFVFGLVPALSASRVNLADAMRAHARSLMSGSGKGRRGASPTRVVITAQVALSMLLLVSAGLLVRSMWSLQNASIGMDRDHLLIADLDTQTPGYNGNRFAALMDQLTDRLARIPGVVAVSYSENGIFSGSESSSTVAVEGYSAPSLADSAVNWDEVGPGYVNTIGARLLEGREFTPQDRGPSATGVMLNETAARTYFGNARAVGKWIRMDSSRFEVIGVVTDAQDHDLRAVPVRRMYIPYLNPQEYGAVRVIVRTAGNPAAVANQVRREIVAQDPAIPILSIDALPALLRASIRSERLVAKLASGFGVLALLLAAIGLYGVMSYAISQRTGEIGLRMALGAQPGDVIRMILTDALSVVGIGIGLGLVTSVFLMRFLATLLHGVGAVDPLSITAAVVVLVASGVVAAFIPARRGARVTPLEALRES